MINNKGTGTVSATGDREIIVSRTFNAVRELVFDAWTDPEHVGRWWGPKGFTTTTYEMDVRPSGIWRFVMHGPDGVDYPNKIVYIEVVRPDRLVYDHTGGLKDDINKFQVTVTFVERNGKTNLTMRMVFPSAEAREHIVKTYGAIEGAHQTLERLAREVES